MKFKKEHVQKTQVYCAKHGKGHITAIIDDVVHVQFSRTRARFIAADGDNGAGDKLHFFESQAK